MVLLRAIAHSAQRISSIPCSDTLSINVARMPLNLLAFHPHSSGAQPPVYADICMQTEDKIWYRSREVFSPHLSIVSVSQKMALFHPSYHAVRHYARQSCGLSYLYIPRDMPT